MPKSVTAPVRISIDTRDIFRVSKDLKTLRRQLPFAMSLALNNTAKDARAWTIGTLGDFFEVRNRRWLASGLRWVPSNKTNLTAWVGTMDDWLAQHVPGAIRTGLVHRRTLPTKDVRKRRTSSGKLPSALQPGKLLADRKKSRVFTIQKGDKTLFFQRVGRRRKNRGGRKARRPPAKSTLKLLYVFAPVQPIARRWPLKAVVETSVRARFRGNFTRALKRAIATSTGKRRR